VVNVIFEGWMTLRGLSKNTKTGHYNNNKSKQL
jgi:hypothetical protein